MADNVFKCFLFTGSCRKSETNYTDVMIQICLFIFFLSSETSTSCGVLLTPRSRKSAIHHPQPLRPDIHVCTHGCMYMNTNMCYRTYIGFSKLGFQALHVQSGPCSHSLTQSRLWRKKQNKNKNRCLSQPQWCLLVFQKWFSGGFLGFF